MRTSFPQENGGSENAPKDSPNISGQIETENVKYPKRLRHNGRGKVLATIYRRDGQQPYRLYWRARVDGKPRSHFRDFGSYSEAKSEGDKIVAGLAKNGSQSALSPEQTRDAQAALQAVRSFYEQTGQRVSLLAGISAYCDAAAKLRSVGRSLAEAVEGYLGTVAAVKSMDLGKAVEDFITGEQPKLSTKYAYNRAIMLRRFAGAFPGHTVAQLTKQHLDSFIGGLAAIKSKSRNKRLAVTSAKSRNHYRTEIGQFLAWAVRKDYLSVANRLGEADGMRQERRDATGKVEFYTPGEFGALLAAAQGEMRAMIAIGGLAGLRTQELLRLDWSDLWRVPGHIEVTAAKSKTRQRRLVPICASLAAWLRPFHNRTDSTAGTVCTLHEITWQQHFNDVCQTAGVTRKANGLRHAFCTYSYARDGEVEAARQAGHSPSMLHAHYRGLTTKAEAKKWFAVAPRKPANVVQMPAKIA